jgi:hypothetical protein
VLREHCRWSRCYQSLGDQGTEYVELSIFYIKITKMHKSFKRLLKKIREVQNFMENRKKKFPKIT